MRNKMRIYIEITDSLDDIDLDIKLCDLWLSLFKYLLAFFFVFNSLFGFIFCASVPDLHNNKNLKWNLCNLERIIIVFFFSRLFIRSIGMCQVFRIVIRIKIQELKWIVWFLWNWLMVFYWIIIFLFVMFLINSNWNG